MRRIWKRILAVSLCTLMLFSVLSGSASALNAKNYRGIKYDYYCYLGDSIPFGYGLVPKVNQWSPFSIGDRNKGSYPDLVGKVLEKNNRTTIQPAASSGSRMCDYRILLERGMKKKNPYNRKNDWYGKRHPERTMVLRQSGPTICKWIKQADLLTIELGLNDITAALVNSAYATGLVDLDQLKDISELNDVVAYLSFALGNLLEDPNVLGNFLAKFYEEVEELRTNSREVLKDLVKLAPKADILVVGYHKPVAGLRVIPGTNASLLFTIVDEVFMSFNAFLASTTEKYDNAYYVDAPDAPVFYPEGTSVIDILQDTDNFLLGVHPNAEGHEYIATQVLDKLNEINKT
ncbi:MAG: hypothetical protein IIZ60_06135 [Clostridia bacterium]|nr:hypothetical protein [Clostridia bacterium]